MKLSEMKRLLADGDIQLTKSLGQNFLHDGNQLRRIAAAAELHRADKVLEIGPGLGPLTELLEEAAAEVLAIEKDGRLVRLLQERFANAIESGRLRLLHEDALDYLRAEPRDWSGWKLVSNLPYSVASPLLVELAQAPLGPERLVATLQLEVAQRLSASAGDSDYGILSLLVQLDYEPLGAFKIPAACFFPAPEVDSGCVTLRRRAETLLPPGLKPLFARVVKLSFSQRRKMVLKLLKQAWPPALLEQLFRELDLPLQARAETLTLDQFVQLTRQLASSTPHEPGNL